MAAAPRRIVAVDFGTSATCAAFADDLPGTPTHVQIASYAMRGDRLPSSVFLNDDGITVRAGHDAVRSAGVDPSRLEWTPKRQVSNNEPTIPLGGTAVPVGTAVRAVIEAALAPVVEHGKPDILVVTHPAAWGPEQIRTVTDAAEAATGVIPVTVSEPVAAAWAAVPDDMRLPDATFAIYDWGGGTFDVAVVSWDGTTFEQHGQARGVDPLGGDNVDYELEQLLLRSPILPADLRARLTTSRIDDLKARKIWHRFKIDVRAAKEELSKYDQGHVDIGDEWTIPVTRHELEQEVAGLVEQTLDEFAKCVAEANIDVTALAGIYLTGDAAKMPLVADRFWARFGVRPKLAPGAKSAVAKGAVLWALRPPEESGNRKRRRSSESPPPPPPDTPAPRPRPKGDPAPKKPEREKSRWAAPAQLRPLIYAPPTLADTRSLKPIAKRSGPVQHRCIVECRPNMLREYSEHTVVAMMSGSITARDNLTLTFRVGNSTTSFQRGGNGVEHRLAFLPAGEQTELVWDAHRPMRGDLEYRRPAAVNAEILKQVEEWSLWLQRSAPVARRRLHEWQTAPAGVDVGTIAYQLTKLGIPTAENRRPAKGLIAALQRNL